MKSLVELKSSSLDILIPTAWSPLLNDWAPMSFLLQFEGLNAVPFSHFPFHFCGTGELEISQSPIAERVWGLQWSLAWHGCMRITGVLCHQQEMTTMTLGWNVAMTHGLIKMQACEPGPYGWCMSGIIQIQTLHWHNKAEIIAASIVHTVKSDGGNSFSWLC